LSPHRWQSVFAVFEKAVDLDPSEQQGFITTACADDPVLRQGVEELLMVHNESATFLDRPLVDRAVTPFEEMDAAGPVAALGPTSDVDGVPAEPNESRDGSGLDRPQGKVPGGGSPAGGLPFETVGPYRLLRKIGQGGMSTVYLAVRDDESFNRQMVIKLVRRDMESEAMLRRLRAERRILASLEHPNIARLYDGGSTESGTPYFVMEYVEGLPVDVYCEQNQLSIDERLALFRKICLAVQFAHQNLVVHRDIKPSNILVNAEGEPKLLDFGIAKLLNPGLAGADFEPTANWQRLMTPSFASPEQIRGEPITTVSDVYSLGVLLYVLLTGRLPHQFEGCSLREIERLLTDTEPPKPSFVVSREAATLASSEKPKASRDSAEASATGASRQELVGDVDAIVLKALRSAPTRRYASAERFASDIERFQNGLPVDARVGTWRYRTAKFVRRNRRAVAAAVLVAVLLSGFGIATVVQAKQVLAERNKKAQVVSMILEVFELSDPYVAPGGEMTVREALERSFPRIERGLEDQPEVRAELLHTTGSILSGLRLYAPSADQLEEALAIRRRLYGENHIEVAETMRALARARKEQLDFEAAAPLAKRAVEIMRQHVAPGDPALVKPLMELVSVSCYEGEYEAAEPLAKEVLAITSDLAQDHLGEITALEYLAKVHSSRGEYAQAVARNREALQLYRQRYGEKYPAQITTLGNIGLQLRRMEDFAASQKAYEDALRLQRETYGNDHASPILVNNLAGLHYATGNYSDAEKFYKEALALVVKEAGPYHRKAFAMQVRLAKTWIEQGAPEEAEILLRRILGREEFRLDAEDWARDEARSVLGASLSAQERCEDGETLLVASYLGILEKNKRARVRDDAFQRLRVHLERCDRAADVAGYEAMLSDD